MAIPMVMWGIAALGSGFITGSLSRQSEVNKLQKEVLCLQEEIKKLKEEVKRLQMLVEEQDKQINVLTMKYHTMKGINFIEKSKAKNRAKGALMYTYCLKEYLDLKYRILNKEYKPTNEELVFVDTFYMILNGTIGNTPEDNAKKQYIKIFIRNIYQNEIDNLIECNMQSILSRIEVA